jgi:hypothetical protein
MRLPIKAEAVVVLLLDAGLPVAETVSAAATKAFLLAFQMLRYDLFMAGFPRANVLLGRGRRR